MPGQAGEDPASGVGAIQISLLNELENRPGMSPVWKMASMADTWADSLELVVSQHLTLPILLGTS